MNNKKLYQDTFSQVRFQGELDPAAMERSRKKPHVLRKAVLIAAAVCLLAGTVAAAREWMTLRDLEIRVPVTDPAGSGSAAASSSHTAAGSSSAAETVPTGLISLAGYMDTPESRALQEWEAFLATYDDGGALERIGNGPSGFEEKYGMYLIYTQAMADKVDEITAKYGLALHKEMYMIPGHGWNDVLQGTLLPTATRNYAGYMYEDGTFHFDGDLDIPGYGLLDFQFDRSVRGSFSTMVLNVRDVADYTQWAYTTACGQEVTLALGSSKGLIFVDLKDSFVVVNVLAGTETSPYDVFSSGPLSPGDLEALADSIDFTALAPVIRPDTLDMASLEAKWNGNEPEIDPFLYTLGMPEAEVQKFFADFLRLAENGDLRAAAEYMAYPVVLEAEGEALWIDTPEALLPYWDAVFTPGLRERILIFQYDKERSDLWVDGVSVMAAGGAIRMEMVDKELKITAVHVENGRGMWQAERAFAATDWASVERIAAVTRAEAETFLYGVMDDLRTGDLSLADRLVYPCVLETPTETVTLAVPEDLYAYYDVTVGADAKTLVMSIGSGSVFAADGLAAAGSGEVWFGPVPGEGLKLFTLQVPELWSIHPATGITAG